MSESSSTPAAASAAPQAAPQSARKLLQALQQEFKVIRECLPLAIGIDKQLLERQPELNRKFLRAALGMHTKSVRYLKVLQSASQRFNLDDSPAGEVSEEQRQLAAKALLDLFKKRAEEHKQELATKAAAEKAAKADQERAEKLSQLMNKFSKK